MEIPTIQLEYRSATINVDVGENWAIDDLVAMLRPGVVVTIPARTITVDGAEVAPKAAPKPKRDSKPRKGTITLVLECIPEAGAIESAIAKAGKMKAATVAGALAYLATEGLVVETGGVWKRAQGV